MPTYFLLFIAIAESVIIAGHYIVYEAIVLSFRLQTETHLIWMLRFIISLLSVSFLTTTIYTRFSENRVGKTLYRIAAAWMGFFIYLFFSSIIVLLYYCYIVFFTNGSGISLQILETILLVGSCGLGIYGLINAQHIQVKNLKLKLPQLPEYWKGKRVVFLSDTHFGHARNLGLAKKLVEKINAVGADLVLHGGDFFDGVHMNFSETTNEFSHIKSTHGIYFATGNHESFEDDSVYTEPLKKSGVHILNNEIVTIEGLNIIGAEYSKTETIPQFSDFISCVVIEPATPSILIKHVPVGLEQAEQAGINLMLSGHTHRGQLWPFRYITKRMFKGYDYGLKKFKDMQVYTSSGAGTWGPPMKVFVAAEIVVFTLE